ncbi:F-box protein cpr1 [Thalictrum thalictroides]|uniref:F-box protein cpr1 n=1 Tax=Thalictrum thalictroides TaxID=46969 RepID=A0A7J6UQR4_THATH|nr:F-box protein cpr1 [Thalictrum thalictroides]
MATYCDMPEDVIFNILLWLPVVSLLRFKSVCKSWCSLIGSSGFITQHLHLAAKNNDKIIRFDSEQSVNHSCTSFSFSLLSGDKFEMCDQIFDLPVPYDRNGGLADIIDTCNGIICLYLPDDIIILWNPAIRQYKRLPQSLQSLWNPAIRQYKFLPENENYVDIHYGFGFDAENNHYKVVRLFIRDSIDLPKCRAEVYNLSNDTWRSIDAAFYCKYLYSDSKVLYRNGIYCCMGMLDKNNVASDLILTFDFTSEVVGALSLPDEFSCQRRLLDLSILRGNIACIHRNVRSSEMHDWHFKIWVLTEYGVKESWTMLYTIRLTYQAWALSRKFSSSGKLLMFLEDKKCLCKLAECNCSIQVKMAMCDCRTHEVSFLPIQLCKCLPTNLQVVVYNESLVSIKNANGEASRASCEVWHYIFLIFK